MKLLKKLLPLASVASAAAIIAPVVTSCATNYDIDLKDYNPADKGITQVTTSFQDPEAATKAYFEAAVKDNYKILKNDLLATTSPGNAGPEEFKAYIKNLKVELKDNLYLLSYKIGYKVKIVDKTDPNNELTTIIEGELLCNNVPFQIAKIDNTIKLTPFESEQVLQNKDWQIKYLNKQTQTSKTVSKTYTSSGYANQKVLDEGVIYRVVKPSWYFEKVTINE